MTANQIQRAIETIQTALDDFGGGTIHITPEGVSVDNEEADVLLDEGTAEQATRILKP